MSTRSIFISGANQGLGFCTAAQLLQKPNVLVFIGSRKFSAAEDAIKKFSVDKSSKVIPVQLDVTDLESVKKAAETVKEGLKANGKEGLDVIVNNAAIATGELSEIFAANVFGLVTLTEALRLLMTSTAPASIINISSAIGSTSYWTPESNPQVTPLAYASSKFAVNGLTNIWAAIERKDKTDVSVVSICPGYNSTNMTGYAEAGTTDPMDGSKVIVEAALNEDLKNQTFFNASGTIPW